MANRLEQLRPETTVGIVATALVALFALVVVLVLGIVWPEALLGVVSLVFLAWVAERSGVLGGDDDVETAPADGEAALDRLRRRYAAGELSDAEFERRLDRLLETETLEDAKRRKARERER